MNERMDRWMDRWRKLLLVGLMADSFVHPVKLLQIPHESSGRRDHLDSKSAAMPAHSVGCSVSRKDVQL